MYNEGKKIPFLSSSEHRRNYDNTTRNNLSSPVRAKQMPQLKEKVKKKKIII